ncbi:hypothetical protein Tco_0771679 [Tanacetum coccineum]|uniref:Uncharacterized protein n=1 Tax=Tanacetum coccineum TaxID=301880 RepID=A0ABQ4ZJG8_9ASTR
MKKLLPTHIPKAIANYVRSRFNTSVLDVMKNKQINLFTQSSTSIDDLSEMDLKLKLLNRIHLNKSNDTHTNHHQLFDTLYDSITLDQQVLDTQDAEPSFHKRSHDNHDTPNDCEEEKRKKQRKDVGQSSSRSSRRNKSLNGFQRSQGQLMLKGERNVRRFDDKEDEFIYADLPRLSLNDVEDMYLLQFQDKLHHLPLEFVKDFNNALLLFIRRVVIQQRVEDIQLGVESY